MITWIKNLLANEVAVFGGLFLISAFSLIAALTAQYVFGLEPCILCLYQRVPYVITALIGAGGLISLYKHEWTRFSAPLVLLAALTFFCGSIIAFYHTGVEQHWWGSFLEGCAADFDPGTYNSEDLMALFQTKPAVRCDQIPWADPIFGISMAGYNTMMSLGLAIGYLLSALCMTRKKNGVL